MVIASRGREQMSKELQDKLDRMSVAAQIVLDEILNEIDNE